MGREFLKKVVQVDIDEKRRLIGECRSVVKTSKGYILLIGNSRLTIPSLSKVSLYIGEQ